MTTESNLPSAQKHQTSASARYCPVSNANAPRLPKVLNSSLTPFLITQGHWEGLQAPSTDIEIHRALTLVAPMNGTVEVNRIRRRDYFVRETEIRSGVASRTGLGGVHRIVTAKRRRDSVATYRRQNNLEVWGSRRVEGKISGMCLVHEWW